MVYSDKENWFIDEAAEGNEIAVKALNCQPQIELYQRFFWIAFWELSSDRPIGGMGGVGAIPFTSIDQYARRFGVDDPDQFRRLLRVIRSLDSKYLAKVNETKS